MFRLNCIQLILLQPHQPLLLIKLHTSHCHVHLNDVVMWGGYMSHFLTIILSFYCFSIRNFTLYSPHKQSYLQLFQDINKLQTKTLVSDEKSRISSYKGMNYFYRRKNCNSSYDK